MFTVARSRKFALACLLVLLLLTIVTGLIAAINAELWGIENSPLTDLLGF